MYIRDVLSVSTGSPVLISGQLTLAALPGPPVWSTVAKSSVTRLEAGHPLLVQIPASLSSK